MYIFKYYVAINLMQLVITREVAKEKFKKLEHIPMLTTYEIQGTIIVCTPEVLQAYSTCLTFYYRSGISGSLFEHNRAC